MTVNGGVVKMQALALPRAFFIFHLLRKSDDPPYPMAEADAILSPCPPPKPHPQKTLCEPAPAQPGLGDGGQARRLLRLNVPVFDGGGTRSVPPPQFSIPKSKKASRVARLRRCKSLGANMVRVLVEVRC